MTNPENPSATSRMLDAPASLTSDGGVDQESRPRCESCNWRVTHTRRFRGRMLCLPCIGEYFEPEGGEDESQ